MIEELFDYGELEGLIDPKFLPNAEASRCFVSRGTNGAIEGYIFSQIMVTVEPVWVAEHKRGSNTFLKLFGHAAGELLDGGVVNYFVCHSDNEKTDSYCKRLGMEELSFKTFKMQLRKTAVGG